MIFFLILVTNLTVFALFIQSPCERCCCVTTYTNAISNDSPRKEILPIVKDVIDARGLIKFLRFKKKEKFTFATAVFPKKS